MRLADLIREERERLGWSQAKLSRESGISPATISRLETGETLGRGDTIARLAGVLGIPAPTVQAALTEQEDRADLQLSDLSKVPPGDRPRVRRLITELVRSFEEKDSEDR